MSAEESVFCIPGLRLIILSYYLEEKKEKKERITCRKFIYTKIQNKIDKLIYCIIFKLYGYRFAYRG